MAQRRQNSKQSQNGDIRESVKPGAMAEAATGVTKLGLDLAIAAGITSAVAGTAGIASAGLSGVGLAIQGLRWYSNKNKNKQLSSPGFAKPGTVYAS
ncbi:MAG: hypothetical protein F6K58_05790 [Symploca sp. SIO2E9]|nr:hypothetical protein [Symploca sp. SIO2E9]